MLAFIGLGTQELILLAMLGTLVLGVVAAIILVSRMAAATRERAVPEDDPGEYPDRRPQSPA
jgi:hypothetical protein